MAYEGIWSDQATEDGVKKLKADIRAKYANRGSQQVAMITPPELAPPPQMQTPRQIAPPPQMQAKIQAPPLPPSPTNLPQPPATPPPSSSTPLASPSIPPQSPSTPSPSSTELPNMSNNNQFNYNVNQKKRLAKVQQNLSDNQAIAAGDRTLYNDYQQRGFEGRIKGIGKQSVARQGLKDNQYDFADLSNYNSGAAGEKNFDMADINYLKKRGVSDDAIKSHIKSLGGKGIHENIRYNKNYAGDAYVGDIGSTGDISNFDVGKGYNMTDINYLKNQGYSDKQIADDMMSRTDKGFGMMSARFLNDQGRLEEWKEAKERAQNAANNSINNSNNQTTTSTNINSNNQTATNTNTNTNNRTTTNTNSNNQTTTNTNTKIDSDIRNTDNSDNSIDASSTNVNKVNDSYNNDIDNSFNTNLDNTNTVDNSTTTTIGDGNTWGAGANIGNNNSVTITGQSGPDAQGGTGLSNMQSIAAYSALNNNQAAQSNQMLNGYGRSAGAISEAERTLGIQDRVANIYNLQGLTQGYWGNKATSQQTDYLGDIWKTGGFNFMMPGNYKPMKDKTEEIASGLNF